MYSQGRLHASHATFESSISPRVLSAPAYIQQPPKTQIRAPTIPPLTPRGMEYGINAHPISWLTVPDGTDRVYACLYALIYAAQPFLDHAMYLQEYFCASPAPPHIPSVPAHFHWRLNF